MSNELHITVPEGVPWIDYEREFDAPVEALFHAHADPDLVRQWLGPRDYAMDIDHWDFRSGGGYRYSHRNPEGTEFGFRGVFHTVRENEFAIQTFEYEGMPDEVAIEFLTFTDLGDGRSRLSGRSVGRTVEGRDEMVSSGMEKGMVDTYDRLEELASDPT